MNRRLATPGALLMLAGVAILYWGLGIFRGETGGSTVKRWTPGPLGRKAETDEHDHSHDEAPRAGGAGTYRKT